MKSVKNRIKSLALRYLPRSIRVRWADRYFYKWLRTKDFQWLNEYHLWTDF